MFGKTEVIQEQEHAEGERGLKLAACAGGQAIAPESASRRDEMIPQK